MTSRRANTPIPVGDRSKVLEVAKNYAFNAAAARALTERQLRDRIGRRLSARIAPGDADGAVSVIASVADEVVALCREYGFVNDSVFAESTALSGRASGRSKRAIEAKLKSKGIDDALIRDAVAEIEDLPSAARAARKMRIGPFRRQACDNDAKERQRLMRRGFPPSVVSRLFLLDEEEAEALLVESNA